MPAFPMRTVSPRGVIRASVYCVVGSGGAVTQTTDHPDITVTPGATGVYDIAFPPSLRVKPWVSYLYASSTTVLVKGTAVPSAANGTWQITFMAINGSAAFPVASDVFEVQLIFESRDA
jgi:hypothetical protein